MIQFTNRTAFSTSASTSGHDDAFAVSCSFAESWLALQASEFDLQWTSGSQAQVSNERAKLWSRRDEDSLAFAFSHKDERTSGVEWHVLVGINKHFDRAQVEVEVAAEGAGTLIPPLGVPAFLPNIVDRVGLIDVWPLTSAPKPITLDNVRSFVDLMRDPHRTLPIVAFSQPLPLTGEEITRISRRVAGAAHIVLVDVAASFGISDSLGREFSVYQGAVRVYPPKLPKSPYHVKLYFPATIQRYNDQSQSNGIFGTIRFADVLARSALDRRMWPAPAVAQPTDESATSVEVQTGSAQLGASARVAERPEVQEPRPFEVSPTLSAIAREVKNSEPVAEPSQEPSTEADAARIAELTFQMEDLRAQNETLVSARDNATDSWFNAQTQLEELQKQTAESQELAIGGERFEGLTGEDKSTLKVLLDVFSAIKKMAERTAAAEAAAQQLREESEAQRREIGQLRWTIEGLQRRGSASSEAPVEKPQDYRNVDAVESYLKKKHGDCIRLHPNAKATLSEGLYDDSDHVIDMLDLLGRRHHAMKTDGDRDGAYQEFHEQKDAIHVKYGPVLSDSSIGEYGHHYEVTIDGNRIDAHDIGHIRNLGTTYTPERMAAIYFHWDADCKVTVITSGPQKLPTPADGT